MNKLIEEHVFGRQKTKALVDANTRYRYGDETALADIADKLHTLIEFYPKHIQKEDKAFFPASRAYFTDEEEQAMLAEFWEFDRKMIHEKYKSVVEGFERRQWVPNKLLQRNAKSLARWRARYASWILWTLIEKL